MGGGETLYHILMKLRKRMNSKFDADKVVQEKKIHKAIFGKKKPWLCVMVGIRLIGDQSKT